MIISRRNRGTRHAKLPWGARKLSVLIEIRVRAGNKGSTLLLSNKQLCNYNLLVTSKSLIDQLIPDCCWRDKTIKIASNIWLRKIELSVKPTIETEVYKHKLIENNKSQFI